MSSFLEKLQRISTEEKYILESRLIQFRKTQIIFVMLSIFLTGNFSDPFISTGTYFISFCLEKVRVQGVDEKIEAEEGE